MIDQARWNVNKPDKSKGIANEPDKRMEDVSMPDQARVKRGKGRWGKQDRSSKGGIIGSQVKRR